MLLRHTSHAQPLQYKYSLYTRREHKATVSLVHSNATPNPKDNAVAPDSTAVSVCNLVLIGSNECQLMGLIVQSTAGNIPWGCTPVVRFIVFVLWDASVSTKPAAWQTARTCNFNHILHMNSCGPLLLSQQHLQACTQPGVHHKAGWLVCVVVTGAKEIGYSRLFWMQYVRGVTQDPPDSVFFNLWYAKVLQVVRGILLLKQTHL